MNRISFVLTMSFISFNLMTKWWYGIIIDGTDEFLYGYPLIYKCRCFHTSMCTQWFALEFLLDLCLHVGIWWAMSHLPLITSLLKRKLPRYLMIALNALIIIYMLGYSVTMMQLDTVRLHRDFDVEMIDSSYRLFWEQDPPREVYLQERNSP